MFFFLTCFSCFLLHQPQLEVLLWQMIFESSIVNDNWPEYLYFNGRSQNYSHKPILLHVKSPSLEGGDGFMPLELVVVFHYCVKQC